MPDQGNRVTVRRLPLGEAQHAAIDGQAGQQMRILVGPGASVPDFAAGVLVEIESGQMLYLGEVLSRQDNLLTVGVEHVLNRAALAAVQEVWQGSRG